MDAGGVHFKSMRKQVRYRVKFTVASTADNRGSHATNGVFELR